ncbi:MAG: cation diffusion facilitator family transporter [Thermoleophilia bacterium]
MAAGHHGHGHDHAHDHGAHLHGHQVHARDLAAARAGNRRSLALALGLNAGFTAFQAVVGFATGSLALLADAGHNLSDVLALALAFGAAWLAARPAGANRTFGNERAEVLAALANALSLVVVATLVLVEAARRFADPPEVSGGWLIGVAAAGVAINLASAAAVFRRGGVDLNMRASFLHLVADAASSVGVLVAGVVVLATGWRYADPILGVLISVLVLGSTWGILRDSVLVLLEAAPRGVDVPAMGRALAAEAEVVNVHDLHVWTITSGFLALSAHVLVEPGADCHDARRRLELVLGERFGIEHTTLQVDHAAAATSIVPVEDVRRHRA